jgi:hypothetical protein
LPDKETGHGMKAGESIHRKLRGLMAVLKDSAVTEHEKANAEALKRRLEKKLRQEGAPQGDWTDVAFRAGQTVQGLKNSTAPPPSVEGPAKIAFRLGRVLGQGLKKWRAS